jgi:carbamoyltransferase
MIILGIHDGHNASAALVVDGKLVSAVGEERFSREKHHYGFPYKAIEAVLNDNNISINDVSRIAMATKTLPPIYFYTRRNSTFSIEDYWKEQKYYWYPKLYEEKNPSYLDLFKNHVKNTNFPYDKSLIANETDHKGMWKARLKHLCDTLKIEDNKVSVYDHHTCHAYYGYFTCAESKSGDVLVYTMDGGGDGLNGTVSIGKNNKPLEFISKSSNCNIGRIYRYVTLLLGMRPADHEYKLMGLAAYNNMANSKKAYDVFAETLKVDGLGFNYGVDVKDHFFHFKNRLEGMRFDAIAYGLQKRTEELLCEWILNGVKETGIGKVIMSGGVAQNIKANKLISEQKELDSLFIPPGPGDESISIGAAYCSLVEAGDITTTKPIKNAYFGISFKEKEVTDVIRKFSSRFDYNVKTLDLKYVAEKLELGDVFARFDINSMEFGARALGNRSIIADPRNPQIIHTINKFVKMRDFWMPFAPSILEDRINDYLIMKENIDARFMAIGFDSTDLGKKHLSAGLHPFDRSARPQIVSSEDNPDYYALISAFEKKTGVGAVLNTSFNIHGEPIVCTPMDALDTFSRCGIQHLILGNFMISKDIN